MAQVIVDTGPIVAILDASDALHDWAAESLKMIQPPLITCEAVLTEVCFLLRRQPRALVAIADLVEKRILEINFSLAEEIGPVFRLLDRFKNVPISLADACLVRSSELHPQLPVFTLDSDFQIYRRNRRQKIPLLIPPRRNR
jgi:predicted nucleic acid-binding protein